MFHAAAELAPDNFGKRHSPLAHRHHRADEVVDGAGEDCAEHNPEQGCRPEHYAHDGAENRPHSGDVEKLNEEDFPRRHGYVVDAVGHCCRGGGALGISAEDAFGNRAIDEVASDKERQRD